MLQNIYISIKCCSLELSIYQKKNWIKNSTAVFSINKPRLNLVYRNKKLFLRCKSVNYNDFWRFMWDWWNDAENSA